MGSRSPIHVATEILITDAGVKEKVDIKSGKKIWNASRAGDKDGIDTWTKMVPSLFLVPLLAFQIRRLYFELSSPLYLVPALMVAYLIVEAASGILHIVLDNEKMNEVPGLGVVARSFQEHHKDPGDIAARPTFWFALEVTVPYMVFGFQALYVKSIYSIAVNVCCYPCCLLMMFAHRWSHMKNSQKPLLCKLLQGCGIIMSDAHHKSHHQTYDNNFAILSGLTNPVLNRFVKWDRGMDQDDVRWLPVLVVYFLFPTIVAVATSDIGIVAF